LHPGGAIPKMDASTCRGHGVNSDPVDPFTLTNAHGLTMRVVSYGGIIVSLVLPDRKGHLADVVLGHDSLEQYVSDTSYFGAIIGRFANRIAGARFMVDGRSYRLTVNDGPNHLHGGRTGFDRVVWRVTPFRTGQAAGLTLSYLSRDGEEGYPGNLDTRVRYTLTDRNELVVDFHATTDQATPVNLTQHTCFNLAGQGTGDILGHLLRINADAITPVDESLIPTGGLAAVAGGPFDFRTLTRIGSRIASDDEQLRRGRGYDHNFVLNRTGPGLAHAARVVEPMSGRTLDVYTTEPGLQFYSGNFIDGRVPGKAGRTYGPRAGFCLETQHFPDSPNHPEFPSTLLRPGEAYSTRTVFAFGVTGEESVLR
jgi:aldose 1-epimerase